MKTNSDQLLACVRIWACTIAVCSIAYPLSIWGIGQGLTPFTANGSLLTNADGQIVGSRVLSQSFTSANYFWPRPSAVDYNAASTGGSNLSPLNPVLKDRVADFQSRHGESTDPIPADLVTASGSGMDPDITLEAALFQVERVAAARGMDPGIVKQIVEGKARRPGGPFTPDSLVNVLEINMALDGQG
ncbi:MAG: potassium-transporting ATPase KdpC subunit [Candidatus Hydrogenedentota bacterium]